VSEEVNTKLRTGNTLAQLLSLYKDPERHDIQRYRWTDRQTDRRHHDTNRRSDEKLGVFMALETTNVKGKISENSLKVLTISQSMLQSEPISHFHFFIPAVSCILLRLQCISQSPEMVG